jgi:transcriptional regulator with XRE-family HTH domain
MQEDLTTRLAERLKRLRQERGLSLEQLAERSGVSRASLSRLENAEVSPTAEVLGKLCAVHGLTASRLMAMVEEAFAPFVPPQAQPVWTDPATGYERRSVSPPATGLSGEVLRCRLPPGVRIAYGRSPVEGLEHHLVMIDGRLEIEVEGAAHRLAPGDCLRYRLHGATVFQADPEAGASYFLFLV